jgi:DNA polymerase IV
MLAELEKLVVMLKQRLDKHGASGSTLTLKLKYADYRQLTRSRTVGSAISDIETIRSIAMALFALLTVDQQKVRLLGLTVSDLHAEQITDDGVQLRLEV